MNAVRLSSPMTDEFERMAAESVTSPDELRAVDAMGEYTRWLDQERTAAHAFADRPMPRAYMDHMLVEGTVNVFYGPPGGMKTLMLASVLAHIAAGLHWPVNEVDENGRPAPNTFRPSPFKTMQARTLLVDYDNGRRPSDDRAEAILRQLGKGPDFDDFRWLSYANPRIDLSDPKKIDQFKAYIGYRQYGVVGIDGLSTVLPTNVKMVEEGARLVLDGLRYVADDTGAAFALLHHSNKAGNGTPQSVGQDLYGSQMILAAADTVWRLDREIDKGQRTNKLNVYCTKNRLGPELPPFSLEFHHIPKRDNPQLMERAWFVSVLPDLSKDTQDKVNAWPVVRAVLQDSGSLTQNGLLDAVLKSWDEVHPNLECPGRNPLRQTIKALINDAAYSLVCADGPNRSKVYRLV